MIKSLFAAGTIIVALAGSAFASSCPTLAAKAEEALKNMENALTQNNDKVVAVVASNDGTAGGVVQALDARRLAGKVLVSGQDADLAACQRVIA